MSDIQKAEKVLADLQAKRARLIARGVEIGDQRAAIAYDAHATGNAKAERRLAELHREAAEYESQLAGLDAAIKTATDRLAKAQQAEAERTDKAAANELRKALKQFVEQGDALDTALAAVVETSTAMSALINQIHALGSAAPTGQQWLTFGELAMHSQLMRTPWARSFRHLAPRERRSFGDLARGWQAGAENNNIAARLGEKETAA
jgi:uncharacterized protein YhaN